MNNNINNIKEDQNKKWRTVYKEVHRYVAKQKKMNQKYKNMYHSIGKFDFDLKYIEALISLCEKIGYEVESKEKSNTLYVGKCLSYGCTSILSDPEGDISIILLNLYFVGYISIATDKVLLVTIKGEEANKDVPYDRLSDLLFEEVNKDKENIEKKREEAYGSGANYVLLLPAVKINHEFAGTVELLGDYADRGHVLLRVLRCYTI